MVGKILKPSVHDDPRNRPYTDVGQQNEFDEILIQQKENISDRRAQHLSYADLLCSFFCRKGG